MGSRIGHANGVRLISATHLSCRMFFFPEKKRKLLKGVAKKMASSERGRTWLLNEILEFSMQRWQIQTAVLLTSHWMSIPNKDICTVVEKENKRESRIDLRESLLQANLRSFQTIPAFQAFSNGFSKILIDTLTVIGWFFWWPIFWCRSLTWNPIGKWFDLCRENAGAVIWRFFLFFLKQQERK